MKVTLKLAIAITAAILVVLAAHGFIRVKRESALFEDDIQRDSRLLGRALAGAVARIWKTVGEAEALDLVEDANEREGRVIIRWVWLDGSAGLHEPRVPAELLASLASNRDVIIRWQSSDDDTDSLYTYVPVVLPGPRRGAVELGESLAEERRYLRRSILQETVATGVLVLLTGALTLALGAFFVGRPVRRLVAQARRIGAGDLSPMLDLRQRDEIGVLAFEMNSMCGSLAEARARLDAETTARLEIVEQLRHADRLTTVGKLAAGVAHEIGTPLNVITGYAQMIADDHPPESQAHQSATTIAGQAHRVAHIIRQLLDFARQRAPRKAEHDLAAVADQVVALLLPLAQKRNVTLQLGSSEAAMKAEIDPMQIQQVLTNLVVNGIHAMPAGGTMTIDFENRRARAEGSEQDDDFACVRIADQGEGIPEDALPRIFEPFFTTKDVGEGTGLGLSVAYGIVKEHGGWIEVESRVGEGSRFTVVLPRESGR